MTLLYFWSIPNPKEVCVSFRKVLRVLVLRVLQNEVFEMSCQLVLELHWLAKVESLWVVPVPEWILGRLFSVSVLHQQAKDFDLGGSLEPVVGKDALESWDWLLLTIRSLLELLEGEENSEPRFLKIDVRHSAFDREILELLVDRLPVIGEWFLVRPG